MLATVSNPLAQQEKIDEEKEFNPSTKAEDNEIENSSAAVKG